MHPDNTVLSVPSPRLPLFSSLERDGENERKRDRKRDRDREGESSYQTFGPVMDIVYKHESNIKLVVRGFKKTKQQNFPSPPEIQVKLIALQLHCVLRK